jgi:hypothetical protein
VRSLRYDCKTLTVDIQGEAFAFAQVLFRSPTAFRVLDERDLCEFWPDYSEVNGWLYEVERGGWLELETHRSLFNSPDMLSGLKEWLIVDDMCISVLSVQSPEIIDLGTDPVQANANV